MHKEIKVALTEAAYLVNLKDFSEDGQPSSQDLHKQAIVSQEWRVEAGQYNIKKSRSAREVIIVDSI